MQMQALDAGAAGTRRHDDEAPALDWLRRMGVVAFDEDGAWTLTEFGSAAMARYYRTSAPPPPGLLPSRPAGIAARRHG